ncbi:MAG: GEVED domain-containing protein [Psychroflexus halocasei]
MKKITFLMMSFMMFAFGYAQDAIITGYVDSPCPGADGRTIEIYVNGTVDFTDWNLARQSNGGGFTTNVDLTSLGSLTDEFVYVTNDEATLDVEFTINSTTHNVIENSVISSNGDDAFQITDAGDVVVDRFGEENVDGTGTAWEHVDTYYYRNDGATANAGAFDPANWTFGTQNELDNLGNCNFEPALSNYVPFGSYVMSSSCSSPSDIVFDNLTESSVDVMWTENGTADEWEILYGEAGFDPLTEGTSVMDTDGTLGEMLSGLAAETGYDVYVRSICDASDQSDWLGPENFTTTSGGGVVDFCGQEQFSNGFENGTFIEESGTQLVANDFIVSSNTVNFSVDQIKANILSEGGIDSVTIVFYEDDAGVPGTEIQTLSNLVPTSQAVIGNAFDYDVHEVVLDLPTAIDFAGNGTDVTYWMELSGVPTVTGTRLGIETTTVGGIGNNLVFDNENTTGWVVNPEADGVFSITGECEYVSGCLAPDNFAAIDVAENSVELSWNATGGDEWTVEYGLEGFVLGSGTEVVIEDTPGVTISGLDSVTAYDFYVTTNCTSGDSVVEGPLNISTVDEYCPVEFSFVEPITLVEVADISNASSEAPTSSGHEFFLDVLGNVEQDGSYTVTVEGNTGGNYQTSVTLFADWDQNGSMDDAGERYDLGFIENSSGMDGVQLIASITVPADAELGETRMRVVKRYSSSGDYPIDSCDSGTTFGQAEDYTLNVSVMTPVTCPAPTAVIIDNVTDTSADVVWTENGSATEWEILYGEAGFDPLTEGTSVMDADGTLGETITGLDAVTDYDVYVRAICDVNDESEWEGPVGFTTTTLGVESIAFKSFSYYPNPVKDELFLNAAHNIDQIQIYNMRGQVMMLREINDLNIKLNLQDLSTGVYLMKVKINNATKTFKLIRE